MSSLASYNTTGDLHFIDPGSCGVLPGMTILNANKLKYTYAHYYITGTYRHARAFTRSRPNI